MMDIRKWMSQKRPSSESVDNLRQLSFDSTVLKKNYTIDNAPATDGVTANETIHVRPTNNVTGTDVVNKQDKENTSLFR